MVSTIVTFSPQIFQNIWAAKRHCSVGLDKTTLVLNAHAHTRIHIHIHAHTHTHTRARAHTHTHTTKIHIQTHWPKSFASCRDKTDLALTSKTDFFLLFCYVSPRLSTPTDSET